MDETPAPQNMEAVAASFGGTAVKRSRRNGETKAPQPEEAR
jgi:hypothetical protein